LGRTDCQFAFVGDGETRTEVQTLVQTLGIGDFVSFPGWLDEKAAFGYLATADIGIEPNLEDIVSPVKAMEYLAFGLPVVAFEARETRELAGYAAAFAPPRDVERFAELIDELLDDPDRRAHMGRLGRRLVEDRLAWDRQATAYVQVFHSLLEPFASRPVGLSLEAVS
jgi:glycosyltransferase involved in cell wall biosynthesis